MRPSFGPEAVGILVKHARPAAPQQALSKRKPSPGRARGLRSGHGLPINIPRLGMLSLCHVGRIGNQSQG